MCLKLHVFTKTESCQISLWAEITCASSGLPAPVNGIKSGCLRDHEPYGTTCMLSCNRGYTPMTTTQRTCQNDGNDNGIWSGGTISCTSEFLVMLHNYVHSSLTKPVPRKMRMFCDVFMPKLTLSSSEMLFQLKRGKFCGATSRKYCMVDLFTLHQPRNSKEQYKSHGVFAILCTC